MTDSLKKLAEAGIHPYGSEALTLYEQRLTRFFSREYRKYGATDALPGALSGDISFDTGPMVIQTEDLMDDHYDRQLPLFKSFLDSHYMAYTMAYYGETEEEIRSSPYTLEQAQEAKFRLACERAGVRGDEKIFSIGCGFGPLETYLFENYPELDITSITPSDTQAGYIRSCMEQPGHPLHGKRFRLIQDDFSNRQWSIDERFDLIFAIGVFEHIHNLDLAFGRIAEMLKPGGRSFLHLIVSIPEIPEYQDSKSTLIGKYFPGGRIWPFQIFGQLEAHLHLEKSWYVNGLNYWKTLDEWHRRYWQKMPELAENLLSEDEIRHWNDYFTLCKVVLFAPLNGSIYGNGHYLFSKPG